MQLNGMIRWWFRLETASGSYTFNSGLSGYTFVAVLCGTIAAVAVLLRASAWPSPGYKHDGALYAALGSIALTMHAMSLVSGSAHWIGFWVGAALSFMLIVAGVLRREAQRQGWS